MELKIHNDLIHYIYDHKNSDTLVIMLHGLTMDSYMYPFSSLANDIYNFGYDVLRFDFIGHGKSYGDSSMMTLKIEIEDAIEVINKFKDGYKNLILIGHSQGGLVALNVAKVLNPYRLILLSPAFNLKDCIQNKNFFGKKIKDNKPVHIWNMTFSTDYLNDIANDSYYDINYNNEITIIHGDKDILVPISYSKELELKYSNIVLKTISNSCHEFINHYDELLKLVKESL